MNLARSPSTYCKSCRKWRSSVNRMKVVMSVLYIVVSNQASSPTCIQPRSDTILSLAESQPRPPRSSTIELIRISPYKSPVRDIKIQDPHAGLHWLSPHGVRTSVTVKMSSQRTNPVKSCLQRNSPSMQKTVRHMSDLPMKSRRELR
jgi:hypothetical protein